MPQTIAPHINPTADVLLFSGFKLQCVGGFPTTWRCFRESKFIGIVFEHPTHWSNAVDGIKYAEPEDAVVGLEDFKKIGGMDRVAEAQGRAIAA